MSKQIVIDLIYPVGAIFMSSVDVNPDIVIGGTWERVQGRFLVGVDDTDVDFNVGLEGGIKDTTLTVDNMAAHTHSYIDSYRAIHQGGHGGGSGALAQGGWISNNTSTRTTNPTGSGTAFTNLPPYLAVFIFTRIA